MGMNDFGGQNFDDLHRQRQGEADHKGPPSMDDCERDAIARLATEKPPRTGRRPYRPGAIAALLDGQQLGSPRRWILCDAETGYPIAQIRGEPTAAPWDKPPQRMAAQVMRAPATAAIAFLEEAGMYMTLCCDDPADLCDECAKLVDPHADCADDPCDACLRKVEGEAEDRGVDLALDDQRERGQ